MTVSEESQRLSKNGNLDWTLLDDVGKPLLCRIFFSRLEPKAHSTDPTAEAAALVEHYRLQGKIKLGERIPDILFAVL
jgi:hypothetical protein